MMTRDECVKNFKAQLDELNEKINKIEEKTKSVNDKAKVKLKARILYLREKRDSALSKIHEIKNTSEETWQDLQEGAENVILSLKKTLDKTMSHFKKRDDNLITGKTAK
jgi:uncharacterized coiled-coil DUF342 family protein